MALITGLAATPGEHTGVSQVKSMVYRCQCIHHLSNNKDEFTNEHPLTMYSFIQVSMAFSAL
jgi:hypothetical protein